jgi:pyrimidine-nucleoside phosphorylase
MFPQEIIRKKRDGGRLDGAEMRWFFNAFLKGEVADYQASALLMAIFLRGMTREETAELTKIARDSGKTLNWPESAGFVVDKHSTGGVGDKTSMIVLPLCLLEGVRVPMIAGRGLGHTGGTLDKLETIPGMNVFLSAERATTQFNSIGGFFSGQTDEIAALDKRLYQLRDVTGTIESNPLIVASILSKKLAEGLSGLVMDVKFGSGAFMDTMEKADALAQELIAVGKLCGLKVRAVLSNMNSPLGTYAGNLLEIYECREVMAGRVSGQLTDLTLTLAEEMIDLAQPGQDRRELRLRLESHLSSGRCLEKFLEIVRAQGGSTEIFMRDDAFFTAKIKKPIFGHQTSGRVESIEVRALGLAVIALGGGRRVVTDKVNGRVGLSALKHVGEAVVAGEPLGIIHADDERSALEAEKLIQAAYRCGSSGTSQPIIAKILREK